MVAPSQFSADLVVPEPHRLVQARHGLFLVNRHDVYIGQGLIRLGEYFEEELDLLRQLCLPGDTVIEVGANIGAHTVPLARHLGPAGRLIAIEPQPAVFLLLCANLALNGLTQVEPVAAAVGAAQGHVIVPRIDYGQPGNFGGIAVLPEGPGIAVAAVPLDRFADVERLTLVKIDVEGMESAVLRGSRRLIQRHRPALYLENDRPDRSEALIRLVGELGYRAWWHLPRFARPASGLDAREPFHDAMIAVNMLCLPQEDTRPVDGSSPVTDPRWHPSMAL